MVSMHIFKRGQATGLVPLHEAAVANYIGCENGGKATFHSLSPF